MTQLYSTDYAVSHLTVSTVFLSVTFTAVAPAHLRTAAQTTVAYSASSTGLGNLPIRTVATPPRQGLAYLNFPAHRAH